jgi:presenilin-like A22 family membrane protease
LKHDELTTAKLMGWSTAGVVLSLLLFAKLRNDEVPPMSQGMLLAVLVGACLVGAGIWWLIIKFKNKVKIDAAMATAMMIVAGDVVGALGGNLVERLFFGVGTGLAYYWLAKEMQKSWENTKKYLVWSNMLFLIAIAGAGALLGKWLTPTWAVALLGVLAIYDGIAVWQSKHMQKFSTAFMDARVFPGFAVAKEWPPRSEVRRVTLKGNVVQLTKKQKSELEATYKVLEEEGKTGFGIIGGGDIFMMAVVSCAFFAVNMMQGIVMAACLIGTLAMLFRWSSENKSYPALPYLFVGAIVTVVWMRLL